MTPANPLHARYYADRALQRTVEVVENVRLAEATYRVRLRCPELARRIVPGQFVMVRLADFNDPLLGRPLALYRVVNSSEGTPEALDLVYLVMGKMTRRLAEYLPGQKLDVWGPLGNGFPVVETEHLILVAGGIGQTPFPAVAAEALGLQSYGEPARTESGAASVQRVTLCYGARRASLLAGLEDFAALRIDLQTSTDDGSAGRHGLVTDLLTPLLEDAACRRQVMVCGPEPMMEAVAKLCLARHVPCLVSLETPMACGVGICFSCVARVRDAQGEWDYKRTCVEGPIFEAGCIEW